MNSLFRDEEQRDILAKRNNSKDFRKTYSYSAKIKDLNSESYWDCLTSKNRKILNSSPIYRDKINLITRSIQGNDGKLLDVGFGHGEIEKILNGNVNMKLFGTEISKKLVNNAKANFQGMFKVGDIYNLPFKSSFFDYVLVLDVLEHLPTKKTFKAYNELSRVLKRNGLLIVSVPLNEGLEEMFKEGKNPNGHLRAYTPDILKMEMMISGFKIIKEKYLYAFSKLYFIKSFFVNFITHNFKKPNLIILFAKKK